MKVLQISNKVPYPEKDGGVIAINAITAGLLSMGCEVKVLAMNTKKHFIDVSSIPEKFRNARKLEAVSIDTSIKPIPALMALLMGKSYNISRFESREFCDKLKDILTREKFDVIHLEGLYVVIYLPLIRQYSKVPIILRTHNIEWKIWEKLAKEEKNGLKKWYLKKLSQQLKKYEEEVINHVDGITTITNQDAEYLRKIGCTVPIITIPFGMDVSKYVMKESKYPNSLFYLGALDWLPNLQGLDWFLKNVWNKVLEKRADAEFHIAGRNMPDSLRNASCKGVSFHGEVEDAKIFIQDYDIMIVPLFAGSGVRIKILEGMAMGKPIIATSVGIEGIECNFGKDVLVADSPQQFADAILQCLSNSELKSNLGKNARNFVDENYSITKMTMQLMEFYNERISKIRA